MQFVSRRFESILSDLLLQSKHCTLNIHMVYGASCKFMHSDAAWLSNKKQKSIF